MDSALIIKGLPFHRILKIPPMTNIEALDRSAVERVEEGGEGVLLHRRVLLLLVQGDGVEEQVRGQGHDQVFFRTQAE